MMWMKLHYFTRPLSNRFKDRVWIDLLSSSPKPEGKLFIIQFLR